MDCWCSRGKSESAEDKERDDDRTGRLDFGEIYGTGAGLGFSPREVDQWSLAEFFACVKGWSRIHGGDQASAPPTDSEMRDMLKEHGFSEELQ